MGDVVNLRRARKAKARDDAAATAAVNRAAFGRTKADRAAETDATARRNRLLDGAKRED